MNYNMPTGYYTRKMSRENDKYDGLFSSSQLRDLEFETSIPVKKVNSKELRKLKHHSKGNGSNFSSPY